MTKKKHLEASGTLDVNPKLDDMFAEMFGQADQIFSPDGMPLKEENEQLKQQIELLQSKTQAFVENGEIVVGGYKITRKGLIRDKHVTQSDWMQVGILLKTLNESLQLLIGDWVNEGENYEYGITYMAVAQQFDVGYGTVRNWAWVARAAKLSSRDDNLTYTHYREVARIGSIDADTDELVVMRQHLLKQAVEHGWTTRQLAKEVDHAIGKKNNLPTFLDSLQGRLIAIAQAVPNEHKKQVAEMFRKFADDLEKK